VVADILRMRTNFACPRCKNTLREVTRVPPLQNEDGLIAYECPACSYVTSVIWPAKRQMTIDAMAFKLGRPQTPSTLVRSKN
jgi:uncharacterized Zn finger protein